MEDYCIPSHDSFWYQLASNSENADLQWRYICEHLGVILWKDIPYMRRSGKWVSYRIFHISEVIKGVDFHTFGYFLFTNHIWCRKDHSVRILANEKRARQIMSEMEASVNNLRLTKENTRKNIIYV
jgi:hypothetical protein